jgi:4-hydroxybenzoyl-CoA thioesterase
LVPRDVARVQIDLPEAFAFRTELPIRIDDINYGGHLGNDAVLSLAHEARVRLFRAHGWSELDVEGLGILMVDAAIVYRLEGRHGMTLAVEIAFDDVRSRGCDLVYRMTDLATGEEIARVKTGIVFFDPGARRVARMPEGFRKVAAGGAEG